MIRNYKYRIYPTEKQKVLLEKHFGATRFIYNLALETKIESWKKGVNLTRFDLQKQLVDLTNNINWLKGLSSQALKYVLLNLEHAYSKFFKGNSDFPKFKKKSNRQSFQCTQNISLRNGKICIAKFQEGIKIIQSRKFEGRIKAATVSKTTTNRYFISVMVESDKVLPEKQSIKPETSIGIDLGLKTFVVLSDGSKIENPKFLRNQLKRLKVLQRRVSKKKKGSKNRKKANLKVSKLYEKITNKRLDFLHKASSKIISDSQTIIVEDLAVANMIQNHKLALSISDVSWSEFIRQLEYKSDWYGKNFIKIGRFEPSSQIHNTCGYRNRELKLQQRYWQCPSCKKLVDRDLNAAINIKEMGLRNSGWVSSDESVEQLTVVKAMKQKIRKQ